MLILSYFSINLCFGSNFNLFYCQVLEEIRVGLELNDLGMQQQRLAHMRLLGELYNYEQLESSVIFDTLYLILIFGLGTLEVWHY